MQDTLEKPVETVCKKPDDTVLQHQLHDAEELTNELKRLLVKYENTLDQEGIRHQVEVLERWMESYRRGLSAASKISETGISWLRDLHDRLKLSAEELQRLEGEGGQPASKEQSAKTEELLNTVRRIEKVIPNVEQIFCRSEPEELAETH